MEVKNPKTLAREIADTLGETHKSPRKKINLIVQLCGVVFAQDILRQTYEVEASGGMLTSKGDRQRTPGGVYFRLAKDQIMDAEIKAKIFPPLTWQERKRQRKALQEKRAAQAARKKSQPVATNAGSDPAPAGRTVVDMPPEAKAQLQQLESAAELLREKLAANEAKGQRAGAEMTRRVLENTERQIAALKQQYTQ